MIFAGLKAAAAPYMLAIKFGIAAVLLVVGVGIGCSCQAKRDQGKIDAANAKTDQAIATAGRLKAQGDVLADQLREIDASTKAARAAADAKLEAVQAEARKAAADTEAALKRAGKVEADLIRAKRDPDCKRLLETKSCAVFR